ncbi:hypothetical protein GCM10017691_24060 [Pseudonocardia petroleophila]
MSTYDPASRSPEAQYAALRTFWTGVRTSTHTASPLVAFLAGYGLGRAHGYEDAVEELTTPVVGTQGDAHGS